jgi:hypothetical protein
MPRADPDRAKCPTDCDGSDHTYCRGHTNAWQDCTQWRIRGGKVCKTHGGSAKQVKAAAKRRLGEERARTAVATYGLPVEIDPGTALLEEVSRSAGHVRWLRDVVQELDADALVWGEKTTSHQSGQSVEGPVDVTTNVSAAGVNVWLELYLKERDHLRKVCTDALKAGIAERQVQLAEQAGERAGQWLRASLDVLGLSDEDMRRVMAAGVAHLHLLEGGAA